MQYTSKIALLAVALFGTSALALPLADEAGFDVEAREVDYDLEAREFYETYLEAREDPSLDARDVESMDLEAREYLEYLEERAIAAATPQTPLSPKTPSTPSTPSTPTTPTKQGKTTQSDSKPKSLVNLSPHQKSVVRAKTLASEKFTDRKVYENALANKDNKLHRFAVSKYLSNPKTLKKVLADKKDPNYKAAKRVLHTRKAKVYLSDKSNYKKALKYSRNKYHKDAVKQYLKLGDNLSYALNHKKAKFHKEAVREYLLDTKTRKSILSDKTDPLYKQARKLQKKLDKKHTKLASDSLPADSTTKA